MVDICKASGEALGLSLTKSAAMCIGRSFKHNRCKLKPGIGDLNVVKYRGVQVCSASKFEL